MPFVIVVVLSVVVGCAVYLGTVRTQVKPPATGFGDSESDGALESFEPAAPAPGTPTSRSRRGARSSANGCREWLA